MKWMTKLFILIVILGVMAGFAFMSLLHASHGQTIWVHSRLQGTKIIHPSEWAFFPERIIPKYITISVVPKTLEISGDISQDLPYADILNKIEHFYISLHYRLVRPLDIKEIEETNFSSIGEITKYWNTIIQAQMNEVVSQFFSSPGSSVNSPSIKTAVMETLKSHHLTINEISITHMPDLPEYIKLKNESLKALEDSKMVTKMTNLSIQEIQAQKILESKQKMLSNALAVAMEKAQSIDEAKVDIAPTLSLLSYLLDKDMVAPPVVGSSHEGRTDKKTS